MPTGIDTIEVSDLNGPVVISVDDDGNPVSVIQIQDGVASGGGSGNVSNSGTPATNQVAIWTGATAVKGNANLTFDSATDLLTLGSATEDPTFLLRSTPGSITNLGSLSLFTDAADDEHTLMGFGAGVVLSTALAGVGPISGNNPDTTGGIGVFTEANYNVGNVTVPYVLQHEFYITDTSGLRVLSGAIGAYESQAVSIATGGLVTSSTGANTLKVNDRFWFTALTTPSAHAVVATRYYVKTKPSASTWTYSATPGGAALTGATATTGTWQRGGWGSAGVAGTFSVSAGTDDYDEVSLNVSGAIASFLNTKAAHGATVTVKNTATTGNMFAAFQMIGNNGASNWNFSTLDHVVGPDFAIYEAGGPYYALTIKKTTGFVGIGDQATAPATLLHVGGTITTGVQSTATGSLVFKHASHAFGATFTQSASQSASYTLTLPVDDGASGEVLSTNGSGVLSWIAAGGEAILDVGTSTISNGTDKCVVYQDGASPTGVFQEDPSFTYDAGTQTLTAVNFVGDGSGLTGLPSGDLTIGSTTITGGSDTQILFNDTGEVGEDAGLVYNKTTNALTIGGHFILTTSGMGAGGTGAHIGADASGRFAFSTAGGTDIGILVPGSTTTAVITLPSATGTLATLAGGEELTNKTLNASVGKGTWTASGTWTLPAITFAGINTSSAAEVTTANALGALAIDVTKGLNTKSISADSTFTFSGTPATSNTWFSLHVTNTDTAAHKITIPSSFSVAQQAAITIFYIPASGQAFLTWRYDGSQYKLYGETPALDNYAATAAPAVTDDVADGYAAGSRWLDVTNHKEYVCESAAAGAAVWLDLVTAGSGTVTVVAAGSLTSTAIVTGGGSQALQTPSATSTLSSGGNMSLAGTLDLAASTDATLARSGAGDLMIESNIIYRAGGTDVPVADGGTGRSTSTTAYALIAAGTTATGAHQTLAAGATTEILVGGGASALPVWTTAQGSGAPVRATSPTITTPVLATKVQLPTAAGSSSLTTGGDCAYNTTNKVLGIHNGTKEVGISTIYHGCWTFDPKAVCDGTTDRLFLMSTDISEPFGIHIVKWKLSFNADPTTEFGAAHCMLKRADAFISVANAADMDDLATTAGASSEATSSNINGDAVVATSKVIYLQFDTAYTEAGHQCIFEMWWEVEED